MYKIVFFSPESEVEKVKEAMFNAGGGRIGNYDQCCWQVSGVGQFRSLAGSSPYIGALDEVTKVNEFRVEMVCEDKNIKDVVAALKLAHPYEEPAFDVWKTEEFR